MHLINLEHDAETLQEVPNRIIQMIVIGEHNYNMHMHTIAKNYVNVTGFGKMYIVWYVCINDIYTIASYNKMH